MSGDIRVTMTLDEAKAAQAAVRAVIEWLRREHGDSHPGIAELQRVDLAVTLGIAIRERGDRSRGLSSSEDRWESV